MPIAKSRGTSCAGTHKWIFAPRGTGIIWAAPKRWARLRTTIPTFSTLESCDAWMNEKRDAGPNDAARMTPRGFTAYEHQWAMARRSVSIGRSGARGWRSSSAN